MHVCSKMMLLCSGEDSLLNSTSTGSDVIMTSNCIYDIIFLSLLVKAQMTLSEIVITGTVGIFRTFLICILRKQGF